MLPLMDDNSNSYQDIRLRMSGRWCFPVPENYKKNEILGVKQYKWDEMFKNMWVALNK